MSRSLFLILCLIVVVAVGGALVLGAFPPSPHPQPVERVLPNDRFQPKP